MKKGKIALVTTVLLCGIISIAGIKNTTNINKKEKVVKQMNESKEISDLNTQINQLNTAHTEYAQYIQNCKKTLATAISNKGVEASENDNIDRFVENIGKIFAVQTADATATAKDISEGKTAYAKGEQLVGETPNTTIEEGVDVVPLKEKKYLYNKGDQCTSITGGWATRYDPGYTTLTIKSDCLSFKSANGNYTGGLSTNKAVDFSGYSRLYVETDTTTSQIGVTTNPTVRNDQLNNGYGINVLTDESGDTKLPNGHILKTINIEDINTSAYVCILVYVKTVNVYEVYIR